MPADAPLPTVSVVIPVRDGAPTLAAAIRSILDQGEPGVEIVVVDDGSTDSSRDVAAAFSSGAVRVVSQPAAGVSAARNRGASEAAGAWLAFLDADDLALPGQLRALRSAITPGVGLVCGTVCAVADDGSEVVQHLSITELILPFSPGSFLVDHRVFDGAGGYDPAIGFGENTELSIRLLVTCKAQGLGVSSVDDVVFRHHRDTSQARSVRYATRIMAATELILTRHADVLRREQMYAQYAATGGVAAGRARQWRTARRLLRSAAQSRDSRKVDWARCVVAHLPAVRNLVWRS